MDYSRAARAMFDYNCKARKLGSEKPKANYEVPKIDSEVDEYAYVDNQQYPGANLLIDSVVNVTLKDKEN